MLRTQFAKARLDKKIRDKNKHLYKFEEVSRSREIASYKEEFIKEKIHQNIEPTLVKSIKVYDDELTFKSIYLSEDKAFEAVKNLLISLEGNVKSLSFLSCSISDEKFKQLVPILLMLPLENFTFNFNFITDLSASEFSNLIISHQTLQDIDLGQNFLSDKGIKQIISSLASTSLPLPLRSIEFGIQHGANYKHLYMDELKEKYDEIFAKNSALTLSFGNGKIIDKIYLGIEDNCNLEVTEGSNEGGNWSPTNPLGVTACAYEPLTQAGEVIYHSS
jgi:hypothetical protein